MYFKILPFSCNIIKRYCSTRCIYKKEFPSTVFSNLVVKLPFNVDLQPLDVHSYPNCDKLIVKLFSKDTDSKASVECVQNGDNIMLTGDSSDANMQCSIETSVKSNLHIITTGTGSISVRNFNGDKIVLESASGNIHSQKCQCSLLQYNSKSGNITTSGTLHAAQIDLKTGKNGVIHVNHMQGLKADLQSEDGEIHIKSSYCDHTNISSRIGNLYLENIHKNCNITSKCKQLELTGFDGCLDAKLEAGKVDAQLSKLNEESWIRMNGKGDIILRLSDWIQQNVEFKILSSELHFNEEELGYSLNETNKWKVLSTNSGVYLNKFIVESELCSVSLKAASWSDMLKLKGIHLSD